MAITQQRMLNLISAAKDYQDAAEKMQAYTRRSAKLVATGKSTAEEQLQYLELMLDLRTMLRDPMNSPATLLVEESHFKSNAGRNRAAARRAAERRQAEGVEPRRQQTGLIKRSEIELEEPWTNTAPESIARKGQRLGSIQDITDAVIEGKELRVPLAQPSQSVGKKKPLMTGPRDVKGLYDDDEPDYSQPIIEPERKRLPEELAAAIQADLDREENLEKYNELNGEKE